MAQRNTLNRNKAVYFFAKSDWYDTYHYRDNAIDPDCAAVVLGGSGVDEIYSGEVTTFLSVTTVTTS